MKTITAYKFNHEVGYLLHEYDQPGRLLVVFGVAPDEADEVIDSWKPLLQFGKVTFLHCFKLTSQRLQMHATWAIILCEVHKFCTRVTNCISTMLFANFSSRGVRSLPFAYS